jgi:signal transduction histidine kinase/CheY-like chemotaxis protein
MDPTSGGDIDLEYRTVRPNGNVHWIVARGRVVFEEDDGRRSAARLIGTVLDITDRKQYQTELENARTVAEEARAAAEAANRVKDDFLATLSHELRTPLNAIIGWAQILESGTHEPGDLEEGLQTIKRNANIQAQLIEDLLDVSRIISGKLHLEAHPVDMTQVIDAAVAAVVPSAEAKKVEICQRRHERIRPVFGDASRLQQVIWNLLTNAVKFTPSGGRVDIELTSSAAGLEIAVTDTGVGIAPEFLPYVFERFRQADASTRRRQGGLGLGLAIVRQLIELHGGTVTAESGGLNQGSRFIVRLPCDSSPVGTAVAPAAAVASDGGKGPLEGMRVLLVDDDDDSRLMLKRVLESLRATVVAANSVAQAMATIGSASFDILISDIGMPDEDGFDLIRKVRDIAGPARMVPAIALTAFARAEDRHRALQSGYQEHVPKPVDSQALAEVIRRLVQDARTR